jgi:uncharacterized protein (TIGR00369 family)
MLTNDDRCFACGTQNPDGLHLEFTYSTDGAKAQTVFVPDSRYQGWQDIVHGGIIMTLLDETMAKAAVHGGFSVLTGEITAKFKNPARIMEQLRCEAEIKEVKKKIVYASGAVYAANGTVIAEATAKMVIAPHTEGAERAV